MRSPQEGKEPRVSKRPQSRNIPYHHKDIDIDVDIDTNMKYRYVYVYIYTDTYRAYIIKEDTIDCSKKPYMI